MMIRHRAYFLVVLLFTLWVGFFGFFRPQEILRALPWPVAPLHARFIGALYLSASAFLLLSVFARSVLQVRTIVYMALIWTGWLLIVSLMHWRSFELAREQVWFWIVAYATFPVAAAWLIRTTTWPTAPVSKRITQTWITAFYGLQGSLFLLLAVLCFLLPGAIVSVWPWKITPFLAQIYSGPLLAYGLGGIMLAKQRNWSQARIPTIGLLLFALLSLIASVIHLNLFTLGNWPSTLWFASLIGLALATAVITLHGTKHA